MTKEMNFEELRKPKSRSIINSGGEKRTSAITLPFTVEEKAKLKRKAQEKTLPMATFIRFILKENDCI